MTNWTYDEARRMIAQYLAGSTSLDEFRAHFDGLAWRLAEDAADGHVPASNEQMIYDVELILSEFSSGHRDETELRNVLGPLARTSRAILGKGAQRREGQGVSPTTTLIGAVAA